MILIVDDDVALADMCSMVLESHGYETGLASGGSDALEKLKLGSYELVISDCAMPGMSGPELTKQIKGDPSTSHVPVMLMSASLRRDVAGGTACGGFIRKPFLAENFVAMVKDMLAPKACSSVQYCEV